MSIGPPSFLFSGLDAETLSLYQELESLGGGETKLASLEHYGLVYPSIKNTKKPDDYQTLWSYDHSIGFRDIQAPKDAAMNENIKHYPVNGSSYMAEDEELMENEFVQTLSEKVSSWINDGYNTCVINLGMRNNGKTKVFFDAFGQKKFQPNSPSHSPSAMIELILQNIFHYKRTHENEYMTTIGVSCWVLKQNQLIDLMVPYSSSQNPLEFSIIECPSYEIALELIHKARSRCKGCLSNTSTSSTSSFERLAEEEKTHFFLRIFSHKEPKNSGLREESKKSYGPSDPALIASLEKEDLFRSQPNRGVLSSFYFVDLIGVTSLESKYFQHLSNSDKIIVRERNSQLNLLFQLFQQMAKVSNSNNLDDLKHPTPPFEKPPSHSIATSARESKLTTILAPIIQGNMKLFVLSFYRNGEAYHKETKYLLHALSNLPKIKNPVYRYKVSLLTLCFFFLLVLIRFSILFLS